MCYVTTIMTAVLLHAQQLDPERATARACEQAGAALACATDDRKLGAPGLALLPLPTRKTPPRATPKRRVLRGPEGPP